MGRSTFLSNQLHPPFQGVEERCIVIPANQTLIVREKVARIIYFMEAGIDLYLPDSSKISINSGDAISLGLPWILRYKARSAGRETRIHVLVIRFPGSIMQPVDSLARKKRISSGSPEDQLRRQLREFHHYPDSLKGASGEVLQCLLSEFEQGASASRWRVSGLCMALVAGVLDSKPGTEASPSSNSKSGGGAVAHARHYMI
jgi:hypothetical protein